MKVTRHPEEPIDSVTPGDIVWRDLRRYFDKDISQEVRAKLADDPDLHRYRYGDAFRLAVLLPEIERLEIELAPDGPATRHLWMRTVTEREVITRLTMQRARDEHRALLTQVRHSLAAYDPAYAFDGVPASEELLKRVAPEGCRTPDSLFRALELINTVDAPVRAADSLPPALRSGYEALQSFIQSFRIRPTQDTDTAQAILRAANASYRNDLFIRVSGEFAPIQIRKESGFCHLFKVACEILAIKYRWDEPGTVWFLGMEGSFAFARLWEVRIDHREEPDAYLTRITLTIDPRLSPEEVRGLYKEMRNQLLRDEKGPKRCRQLSQTSLLLSNFVYIDEGQERHAPFKPWRPIMANWNRQLAPSLQANGIEAFYSEVKAFRQAAQRAYDSLLPPKYSPPAAALQYPSAEDFMDVSPLIAKQLL